MATDIAQMQHQKLNSWTSGKSSPPATASTSLSCALESSMKMWQVCSILWLGESLHGIATPLAVLCSWEPIDVGRPAVLIETKLSMCSDSGRVVYIALQYLSLHVFTATHL